MTMLTIWGRNTSSNVQIVMWAVGELGLAHERIDWGGAFGGNDDPEYLRMNPNGLIPTVRDG
ncbi:MAG TPA: glutathione S-transferase, partial [Thermohalobaculum sp.]|nr:glutathione S-transferase [Thermohalobaculum sp.]